MYHHVGGPKRRKVTRTTINNRGEEVTEEVWEDTQEASASEEPTDEAHVAQPQGSPANSPAAQDPAGSSEDVALKEQPGTQMPYCLNCRRTHALSVCDLPFKATKVAAADTPTGCQLMILGGRQLLQSRMPAKQITDGQFVYTCHTMITENS